MYDSAQRAGVAAADNGATMLLWRSGR